MWQATDRNVHLVVDVGDREQRHRDHLRRREPLYGILGLDRVAQQRATDRAHQSDVIVVELFDQRCDRGSAADIRTGLIGGIAHLKNADTSVTQVTAGGGEH